MGVGVGVGVGDLLRSAPHGGQEAQDEETGEEVLAQLSRTLQRRGAPQAPQPPSPKGDGRVVQHEVYRTLAAAPLLGR